MNDDGLRALAARLDLLEEKVDRALDMGERFLALGERLVASIAEMNERLTYREKILVGWKEIAAYLGIQENSACNMGHEEFDPLPFEYDLGGNVIAQATALDAWKQRRARRAGMRRREGAKAAAATRAGRAGRNAVGDPS